MKQVILVMLMFVMSSAVYASTEPLVRLDKQTVKSMDESEMQARHELLEARVLEIQAMDLKSLERIERQQVKQEMRYIQKEMKALGNGGIYISTTALVIIIILLIIL